jgi:dihydrofolate reductase
MNFSIIAAMHHSNRAIGTTDNKIPWSCPEDMRFFRKLTMHTEDPKKVNAVIMGSNTWTSLGCKPLPNRLNIVLSRKMAWMEPKDPSGEQSSRAVEPKVPSAETQLGKPGFPLENVMVCSSLDEALHRLTSLPLVESAFVIGGQNVYEQALQHPLCIRVYLNKILVPFNQDISCNTFFPMIDYNKYELLKTSEYDTCINQIYARIL